MTTPDSVTDVSVAEFPSAVLDRSHELPVLVDFWAPWCGPCRVLGPILEKLAAEMAGAFELVKVNADLAPELAASYGVQGIPAVFLFKDGEVVDRFVGALPEGEIRRFLRPWCPSDADREAAEGSQLLARGDLADARARLEEALKHDPAHAGAHLGLARLALREGEWDAVSEHVEAIPASADEFEPAQKLAEAIDLARQARQIGEVEECRARIAESADDVEAQFALGGHALAAGDYPEALERFLAAAEADRDWQEQAPRRAMLVVFGILGARHPLSDEYRDRLVPVYY